MRDLTKDFLAVGVVLAIVLGIIACIAASKAVEAAGGVERPAPGYAQDDLGNPIGTRAGGRFEYVQYDDAMEVVTDTETGSEYLVWYWRDDVI